MANNPLFDTFRKFNFPVVKANTLVATEATLYGLKSKNGLATDSNGKLIASVNAVEFAAVTAHTTLALTHAGVIVDNTSTNNINITVPPNADVAFPVGTRIWLQQSNTGTVTAVAGSGVTINKLSTKTLVVLGRYGKAELVKTATNTWILTGDLVAA